MAYSVYNGSGSAFGGGANGRSFGTLRLTNGITDFKKYLDQVRNDPIQAAQLGMVGYEEGDAQRQYADEAWLQSLAEGGASPAMIRALRAKRADRDAAYLLRQAEQPGLRRAEFNASIDAPGSWQGWSPYEAFRQSPMQRIRFA